MTTQSLVPGQNLRVFLLVSMAILAAASVSAQDVQRGGNARRQPQCVSDEGTIRACLVPERQLEGRVNIPIGESGCYWMKESEQEKAKRYKRKANGRPRQFAFQVTNLCGARVEVRLDLAVEGTLRFQTDRCEMRTAAQKSGDYLEVLLGSIRPTEHAVVACDTLPYKAKWLFGKTLRRTFRLAVIGHNGTQLPVPVFFDPEVVLEKSGDH